MVEQGNYLFKIIIIGDSGVGKTSLMVRFSDNQFTSCQSTMMDFKLKDISFNGKIAKLQIWDTAGQERFRTITAAYYIGIQGCIIVFDITERSSFNSVSNWISEMRRNGAEDTSVVLVGAKKDLEESRQVSYGEAKVFADQNHMDYIEVSSLNGQNVEEAFNLLAKGIIFKLNLA